MREKVALAFSGQDTKEDFVHAAASGGLHYAILCSVRVLVKKTAASGDTGAAEHGEELSAFIVATEPQSLEAEAAPNKSWMELQTCFESVAVQHRTNACNTSSGDQECTT